MSASHISQLGRVPDAEQMTRDQILEAITTAKRPGVAYTFKLFSGTPCEHCGEPASPLMRFTRTLAREAWIVGIPDDGSHDQLICAVRVAELFEPDTAMVVASLREIAAELNASP